MAKGTLKLKSVQIQKFVTVDQTHYVTITLEGGDAELSILNFGDKSPATVELTIKALAIEDIFNLISALQKAVFNIKEL